MGTSSKSPPEVFTEANLVFHVIICLGFISCMYIHDVSKKWW